MSKIPETHVVSGVVRPTTLSIRRQAPFFLLAMIYTLLAVGLSRPYFAGDEGRYVQFANNLCRGFYSPTDPWQINLWNGPGYPLVLVPFTALGLPWIWAKIANSGFLLGALLLLQKTLKLYIPEKSARRLTLILGIYPPFLSSLHRLLTEPFVLLLVSAFGYLFCRSARSKHFVTFLLPAAALILAWLMLTKIIFGYIVATVLVLTTLYFLFGRKAATGQLSLVCGLALLICSPYLVYTYALTGKIFYWGNPGGLSLYWMSSPHPQEFGDWHNPQTLSEIPELEINHGTFFRELAKMPPIKADQTLKERAIDNIRNHPGKYLLNIVANIGRMLFSYPYAYANDRLTTSFWAVPNMFVSVVLILCIYPGWVARKTIPDELFCLVLLGTTAFAVSALLSAYARQFYILVPFLVPAAGFILFKVVRITVSIEKKFDPDGTRDPIGF